MKIETTSPFRVEYKYLPFQYKKAKKKKSIGFGSTSESEQPAAAAAGGLGVSDQPEQEAALGDDQSEEKEVIKWAASINFSKDNEGNQRLVVFVSAEIGWSSSKGHC